MLTLHELQCRFRDALLANDSDIIETLIQAGNIPPQTRLGIYRNNVFTNLREALRTIFPVINKLVGAEFFNYATDVFIQRYPSPAGDLNRYGGHFADFLADFAPAAELVYLPDVARLEWHAHQVYHASEVPALDLQMLSMVAPNDYGKLQFDFNPACALLEFSYPAHQIWQVNQANYRGDPYVDLNAGSVRLLISRQYNLIVLQPLTNGEWILLNALATGENFASACHNALQTAPDFDVGRCLREMTAQAILVGFRFTKTKIDKS